MQGMFLFIIVFFITFTQFFFSYQQIIDFIFYLH